VRLGNVVEPAEVEVVPSGFPALDAALGIGGLPCGRISEISGPDSSGKQALAAHLIAQCQRAEGVAAYIDVGHWLDAEQMRVIGVDLDSLLVVRPGDAPWGMEAAVRLARGGGIRLLVFDATESYQLSAIGRQAGERIPHPVASPLVGDGFTSPPGRRWGQAPTLRRAVHPREGEPSWRLAPGGSAGASPSRPSPITHHPSPVTSLLLRRLVSAVDRNGVAFVFITNSESSASSSRPSRRGGQALRFFASIRLEMERSGWIRRGREIVGCRSTVRVAKNKLSPPHREATVELPFYRFPPSTPAVQLCQPAQETAPPASVALRAAAQL
jgi:recombination protein RecA